jgi:cyanobactin maturation PatA/PatG family protease
MVMVPSERRQATTADAIAGIRDLWKKNLGDPSICVAILDGQVDLSHPCFAGSGLTLLEELTNAEEGRVAARHGTHVASLIFAQHEGPVKGIAPLCKGICLPIFRDEGGSIIPCSQLDLTRAILKALDAGANIINISGGQYSTSGKAGHFLEDAIRQCREADVLVVAAAGNDGCRCLHVPGAIQSVLPVGAMREDGSPLDFSNWGYEEGVLASGESIEGAAIGGGTEVHSGTSSATAIVSGVAALLMSLARKLGKPQSGSFVRSAILSTARGCEPRRDEDCHRLLGGRLDVRAATALIESEVKQMQPREVGPTGVSEARSLPTEASSSLNPSSLPPDERLPPSEHDLSSSQPGAPAVEPQSGPVGLGQGKSVTPSACACGGGNGGGKPSGGPQKLYVLGKLGFDYGSRSRRLWYANAMRDALAEGRGPYPNVDDPRNLFNYLTRRASRPSGEPVPYTILEGQQFEARAQVTGFYWILIIDETPIYAIAPRGPFAFEIHDTLVGFLRDQLEEGAERISVPGIIIGEVNLFFGETIPVIQPDIRGMFSWKTSALAAAAQGAAGAVETAREDLEEFLTRVYDQTRNLGVTSQERALNYAATDALILQGIFNDVRSKEKYRGYALDTFTVQRSPICRADFDCWDVHLFFYDPNNLQRARRGFRFTVDVSDVLPVMLGERKEFSVR